MTPSDGYRLTERDRRVVEWVSRFRLLNRDQLMQLAPFGSLTRANTRLAFLVRDRLLSRKLVPSYPGKGGAQALYFVGRQAEVVGISREALVRQMRQVRRWDLSYSAHVLAANALLTAFVAALKAHQSNALLSLKTEPELREALVNQPLVPDGWVSWVEADRRFNVFLEVDLHSEGLTEWRAKVLNYLRYLDAGLHAEVFGYRSFRVLVVCASMARQKHLREVAQSAGRLFLFAQMSAVSAQSVLCDVWTPSASSRAIRLAEA
jgi:hypothetical protein